MQAHTGKKSTKYKLHNQKLLQTTEVMGANNQGDENTFKKVLKVNKTNSHQNIVSHLVQKVKALKTFAPKFSCLENYQFKGTNGAL